MKEGRDFSIIFHINSHYNDLKDDVVTLDSFQWTKKYSVDEIENFARSICEKAHPYTIIV